MDPAVAAVADQSSALEVKAEDPGEVPLPAVTDLRGHDALAPAASKTGKKGKTSRGSKKSRKRAASVAAGVSLPIAGQALEPGSVYTTAPNSTPRRSKAAKSPAAATPSQHAKADTPGRGSGSVTSTPSRATARSHQQQQQHEQEPPQGAGVSVSPADLSSGPARAGRAGIKRAAPGALAGGDGGIESTLASAAVSHASVALGESQGDVPRPTTRPRGHSPGNAAAETANVSASAPTRTRAKQRSAPDPVESKSPARSSAAVAVTEQPQGHSGASKDTGAHAAAHGSRKRRQQGHSEGGSDAHTVDSSNSRGKRARSVVEEVPSPAGVEASDAVAASAEVDMDAPLKTRRGRVAVHSSSLASPARAQGKTGPHVAADKTDNPALSAATPKRRRAQAQDDGPQAHPTHSTAPVGSLSPIGDEPRQTRRGAQTAVASEAVARSPARQTRRRA